MPLSDDGVPAIYPYTKLREIERLTDARNALLDETHELEAEFGLNLVQPFYQLVWTLNGSNGIFTSHTAIAPRDSNPPFDWARAYVAGQLVLLSRRREQHHDYQSCLSMSRNLAALISSQFPVGDFTGWRLAVGPCRVIFTEEMASTTFESFLSDDIPGYGCQLTIGGAASNRNMAAQRWNKALTFVDEALHRFRKDQASATPHRHTLPGTLSAI